jgi:hypothetical protein
MVSKMTLEEKVCSTCITPRLTVILIDVLSLAEQPHLRNK